jgi:hypothetical protein
VKNVVDTSYKWPKEKNANFFFFFWSHCSVSKILGPIRQRFSCEVYYGFDDYSLELDLLENLGHIFVLELL